MNQALACVEANAAPTTRPRPAHADSAFDNSRARTEATLLEYGEKIASLSSLVEDEEKAERTAARGGQNKLAAQFETKGAGPNAEKDAQARAEAEKRELARLESLRSQLSDAGSIARVSGSCVGALVGLQGAESAKAAAE